LSYDEPLLITGCPRTGTTALGKAMNNVDGVCIFREFRIFEPGHNSAKTILAKTHNSKDKVRNRTMVQWLQICLNNQDINIDHVKALQPLADKHAPCSEVLNYLMSLSRGDIRVYGDKTPLSYVRAIDSVVKEFPKARWIFTYRDPRAVAFSGLIRFGWKIEEGYQRWLEMMTTWRAKRDLIPEDQRVEVGPGSEPARDKIAVLLSRFVSHADLEPVAKWVPRKVSWGMPDAVKKEMELWGI
jgi:hypothetical protein